MVLKIEMKANTNLVPQAGLQITNPAVVDTEPLEMLHSLFLRLKHKMLSPNLKMKIQKDRRKISEPGRKAGLKEGKRREKRTTDRKRKIGNK